MKKQPKNEALENLDIEQALSLEGVDFEVRWGGSGRQLNLRSCPFCGNNKYKVYVNSESGLGNCFAGSCPQGTFNKWQLLKSLFDLEPREMMVKINSLAQAQGWRPKSTYEKVRLVNPNLPDSAKVSELQAMPRYLQERGINNAIADYFDLRLCRSGTFKIKTPDGRFSIQDYSNRVIIPIYDIDNVMVSFQGRDITNTSEKKYLFPPMYSSTGAHLYNINNWSDGMDSVVISEGVFDVIGVKKALANTYMDKTTLPLGSFGMSLSVDSLDGHDQISKLLILKSKGLKNVYILWDNERIAIGRAIEIGLKIKRYGFNVKICTLKKSKDPGEAPASEILDAINNATTITSPLLAMTLQSRLCQGLP
jgi:DNA primase